MNEQDVLHDVAVTQNRGGAFARFLRLIRFSHTIFALPFAFAALVVSANGRPSIKIVLLVLGCMVAAWIAQTGRVELPPLVLALGVVCWVSGFDLIYATQDYDFDREEGLHSLVVRLGLAASLRLAQFLHLLMLLALIAFGIMAKLGTIYFAATIPIAAALFYEHRSARQLHDLAAINRAFFNSNAFVSAVFLGAVCADRF